MKLTTAVLLYPPEIGGIEVEATIEIEYNEFDDNLHIVGVDLLGFAVGETEFKPTGDLKHTLDFYKMTAKFRSMIEWAVLTNEAYK